MSSVVVIALAWGLSGTAAAHTPIGIGAVACGAFVLALAWAMAPREIVVDDDELRIERRAWRPLRVPLSEVESAGALSSIGVAVRLFGVGGLFGSYGLFSSRTIGRFWLYATHRGTAVLVRRRNGALPIVVTPDDIEGALAAIAAAGQRRR